MIVPNVAAATFTRLLPSKTVAKNLSGLSETLASCFAPLTPLSTRYLMRSLGREIKADSALEKKAESAKQTRKANKSQLSASSIYHHPLNPSCKKTDDVIQISFHAKGIIFARIIIALTGKFVKKLIAPLTFSGVRCEGILPSV